MTDLPPGWELASLETLVAAEPRAITDGPFGSNLKSSHYVPSGPRVIRLQNIGAGRFIDERAHISAEYFEALRAHEVRAGDLVVASLGQDLPRACLVPPSVGRAIVKADCIRVRLHRDIDGRYVNYALQRPDLRAAVQEQVHGVGRPRLGMAAVRALTVPLAPRSEQERIVAAIEEHLSRLDAAELALGAAQRRLPAVERSVVAAFSRRGTGQWTTLGAIAELKGGVTKDAKRQSDNSFVEVPYLRVANVQRGHIDLTDVATIRVGEAKLEALRLRPGDMLFNEGGDRDKLGRGWVWEGQIDPCIHQNHVFRGRLTTQALQAFDPYFVSIHANTWGRHWFENHGRQTTNLASISLSTLKQLPVPVVPLDQQRTIVQEVLRTTEAEDRLGAALESARRKSTALRGAVLAAAFSGRLVPQDPTDEPASVLLERIRAQRAAAVPTKRARKVKAS